MGTGVIYLDIDDEITSAAARIRDVPGGRVAVVLPQGSRVATSRINFRLLARDAGIHGKRLSIVAGDAATRSLAASAGLATFSSVMEYEGSLEPGATDTPDAEAGETARVPTAPRRRRGAKATDVSPQQATLDEMEAAELAAAAAALERERGWVTSAADLTAPAAADPAVARETPRARPAGPAATPPFPGAPIREPARSGGNRAASAVRETPTRARGGARLAIALVTALVVLVAGVGTYLFLPAATIVVTPRADAVTPVALTIAADPAASEPDPERAVVPAEIVTVDVSVSETFQATGKRVEATKATAIVRFRNKDFTRSNTIPAGSVVSTNNGIRFTTDATIVVPRANIVGLQVFPKTATVAVTAVKAGPEGNVEPNTIVVIPKGEEPISLDVNNPDEGSGGTRTEFPKIAQEDIDAALAALQPALETAFRTRLGDPTIASPGATVFAATAVLGLATPSVDTATLLDQEVPTFELGLSATGTATAVDEGPVAEVAGARLAGTIDDGHRLVEGSVKVDVDPAIVSGGRVTFPVTATASQVPILDAAALKASILGLSLADARAALEPYGRVELSAWPDWVGSIPTIDGRVDLRVSGEVLIDTADPSAPP